jgi:hypothetical protein
VVTVVSPHPEHTEPGIDLQPSSFDSMISDCAEVSRHLAEVPHPRGVRIPARAIAIVEDLDTYGD